MFYIEDIEKILKTNSDPKRAEKMSAYMRNHFDFYGIGADKRRKLTNTYIKEAKIEGAIDWPFLAKLFSHNKRELAYLGLDILKAQSKLLSLEDFDNLVSLAQIKPWWDTIDNIDGLIGLLGHEDDDFEKRILDLAADDNFWLRRIAIGHQRKYKEKTNPELLVNIIKINLKIPARDKDEKFFIDKAIGWALREYSKTNPAWVKSFITKEASLLSSLSTREASKYLK